MSFKKEIDDQWLNLERVVRGEVNKTIKNRQVINTKNINYALKKEIDNWDNKNKNNTDWLNNLSDFRPDTAHEIENILKEINLKDIDLSDPDKIPYILFGVVAGALIFLIGKLLFSGWFKVILFTGLGGLMLEGGLAKKWKFAKSRFNRIALSSYLAQLEKYKDKIFSAIDDMN